MQTPQRTRTMVLALALLGGLAPIRPQQIPDNPLLREYMAQKGISETEARAIMGKAQARGTSDSTGQAVDAQSSPVRKIDTLAVASAPEAGGIYEDIVSRRVVNPDSVLKTLRIFGHDVFRNTKPSAFSPANNLATPASYIVGPSDEIVVILWGRINEEYRLKVDRDGRINLPHSGPVSVAGLPFGAMQKTIQDRLQAIEGVQASVSMGDLRSIGVYIVGEVRSPGLYTVSSLSNVTNALFAAGGPTKLGSLRNVQLKRGGAVVATIDFYDFLSSGKDNSALQLKSGDVILVPVVKRMAAIAGNVRKSAFYEIEAKTSLKDLVSLAGGVTPAAWTSRIQVERYQDNQYQVVLDLVSEQPAALPDFPILDGDIVKIFAVVVKDKNAVYLSGNVQRPGKYEFKEGMKVTDLIAGYGALLPESYLDYAIVIRKEPPSFREQIVPFSLKKAIDEPSAAGNLALRARDEVIVYPRDYFEPDRVAYIDGAVNAPGKQPLLENMKVRDLIIKAGGLTDEASMERGELYRRSFANERVSVEKMEFCVGCALADDPQANMALKRYDRVYIRKKAGWEEEKRVVLRGEFLFPGEYVVMKNETLDQLVRRCGGFTQNAFLPAAVFTRSSVRLLESKRTAEYAQRLDADAVNLSTQLAAKGEQVSDARALLAQQQLLMDRLRNTKTVGRVVMDLTDKAAYAGFNLEDGDELYVPSEMGTVSVLGEVYNPATFRFTSGTIRARQYVEMAGGYKESADRKNVYIIKSNGSVETRKSGNVLNARLGPGDAIVVPTRIEYRNDFKTFIETVDATFKIVAVISSVVALLIAVNALK